jgi:TetR/AcrR family transcriptional regulator, tetracycline repressor protein
MPSRRDDVLQAALVLLDEVGLDRLTVRRLAEKLGVQPGALYRHYPNKRALLDAMVEHIASEGMQQQARPQGDWREQARWIATSQRAGMLTHRDGARLLATFLSPGPSMLSSFNQFTDLLRSAGASTELAVQGVDTIVCYVSGFTIEEQSRASANPTRTPTPSRDQSFRAGLDLILDGFQAALQRHATTE